MRVRVRVRVRVRIRIRVRFLSRGVRSLSGGVLGDIGGFRWLV